MKILYERSFERDIKKIKDKRLRVELREIIKEARDVSAPSEIRNLKSLSEKPFYCRIKIHDYRVGVKIKEAHNLYQILASKRYLPVFPIGENHYAEFCLSCYTYP